MVKSQEAAGLSGPAAPGDSISMRGRPLIEALTSGLFLAGKIRG